MQDMLIPNLQWYIKKSASRSISPRCPFASVKNCPRFYQSLSLLGKAGSTKIPQKEDKKLLKKWKKSDLWPVTDEQATSIAGPGDRIKHYSNFCPEISYERFGIFASHLNEYGDDIDKDIAHSELSKLKMPSDDWRWVWDSIHPQHYTECSLYSGLINLRTNTQNVHEDIVELKPNVYGVGLNINALIRKIRNWLNRVNK
jgi:hypothetical protein